MYRANVVGDMPHVDSTSFVDPSAILIGRVEIGANCYVGPCVVIRAERFSSDDEKSMIIIGNNCSIQDMTVIHAHEENTLIIGDNTLINHGAIIHGPTRVGKNCYIGSKCAVVDAVIMDDVFIRMRSTVEDVTIPQGSFLGISSIVNSQEVVETLRPVSDRERGFILRAIKENKEYPVRYKYSIER